MKLSAWLTHAIQAIDLRACQLEATPMIYRASDLMGGMARSEELADAMPFLPLTMLQLKTGLNWLQTVTQRTRA